MRHAEYTCPGTGKWSEQDDPEQRAAPETTGYPPNLELDSAGQVVSKTFRSGLSWARC